MHRKLKQTEAALQSVGSATQVLREEHRLMERAMIAFAGAVGRLEQHSAVDRGSLIELAETFALYADRWHHSKEGFLVSQMLARGRNADEFLIRTFHDEHVRTHPLLSDLSQAANEYSQSGSIEPLANCLRQAVDYYPGHMWKADHLLFPLADAVLTPADQRALEAQFVSIEEMVGRGMHARLRAIVEEFGR